MPAVVTGCQDVGLVRVSGRCGCECVAAPILADQPPGTQLTGGPRPEPEEPARPKSALEQTLDDTKITLIVDDQTFADVVKTLAVQTGLNFVISPAIAADVGDNTIVTLHLVGVKLSTALNLLATMAADDVEWAVVDEVVVFRRETE